MMKPTVLIYSSHTRCEYLHSEFLISRALEPDGTKTVLHLPMSARSQRAQRFDYSAFRWYYQRFRKNGLSYHPFYWNAAIRKSDAEIFFEMVRDSQVLVLGGGLSSLGLARYVRMGEILCGNGDLFRQMLWQRHHRGRLTAGFSAGAEQLSQYLSGVARCRLLNPYGFGLAKNIAATVHYVPGRNRYLKKLARILPQCLVFALPNDSGLAITQGPLFGGGFFQIIHCIVDCSWDNPADAVHVKTRMGAKIQHFYPNGKEWGFNGGDLLVRLVSADEMHQEITIVTNRGEFIEYRQWKPSPYRSIEEILHCRG